MNAVVHLAGGGGTTMGAMAAGCTVVNAVEMDPKIAEYYALNLGNHVTVAKVEDVDPSPYVGIDVYTASPVCTRASGANVKGKESEVDMTVAMAVVRFIRTCRPRIVMIENVWQYRRFKSCQLILDCLFEEGYFTSVDHVNAADVGVPQTRKRMIIRALRDCPVPPLPKPEPWIGWYAAIEDLIPGLQETQFAPWQLLRIAEMQEKSFLHMTGNTQMANPTGTGILECSRPANTVCSNSDRAKAYLIEGDAAGERCPTIRDAEEPAFTLKTAGGGTGHRAFLCGVNGEGDTCIRNSSEPSQTIVKDHGAITTRAMIFDGQTNDNGKTMTMRTADAPMFTIGASAEKRPARAFLINESSTMEIRHAAEPAACQVASPRNANQKGWLEQGRTVAMSPRCLARFQSVPDWYILPEKTGLASTIIGNMVCPLLAEKILRQLMDTIK